MCKTHRVFLLVTVAVWVAAVPLLIFTPNTGAAHNLALVLGCLAVVLLPYCAFPYLVADMLDEKLKDTTGAFLAGWQAAQEEQDEPDEPATVHPIRSCG
jgi:hypothetical protein